MTPEGKVRTYLRKRAKALGFEHRKLRWIGRRGAPDEYVFWPEGMISTFPREPVGPTPLGLRPVGLRRVPLAAYAEVKRLGEVPEAHQQREIDRLRDAGHVVYVVDSPAQVDAMLDDLTAVLRTTS